MAFSGWRSKWLVPLVGSALVGLALYQLLSPRGTGARSFSSVSRISYTPESFKGLVFFRADGSPLVWCYRAENGTYELYAGAGKHPRYGTDLQPITEEVVKALEKTVQGSAAGTTPLGRVPPPRPVPLRPSAQPSARRARTVEPREQRRAVEIPAGTLIAVTLSQPVSTDRDEAGQDFTGTLGDPLVVEGVVVAPGGAEVVGRIVSLQDATKGSPAAITLQVERVQGADRTRLDIASVPLVIQAKPPSKLKKGLKVIGGAIAGALAGGAVDGKGGAKKGAILGAGAGVAAAVLIRGKSIEIPAQSILPFQTERAITVSLALDATEHYTKRSADDR